PTVTLHAVVILTVLTTLTGAADPECVYRKIRGLSLHWPNPSSCASYYRCSSKSTVRSVSCPPGKEYNPKNGKCSTSGRGLCTLTLAAPLAETTNACADQVNGAYLAKSGYCSEFFICDKQMAYPQVCTAGSYFNTTTSNCVPDTDSECWQNKCIGRQNGQYLPKDGSCTNYYICQNDEATPQSCASGSYFDTALLACVVDEDNKNCWENFCIGKKDGAWVADNENCTLFYVCAAEKAIAQECSNGTYFDGSGPHCVPGTCPDKTKTTTTTPATGCDCEDGSRDGQLVANKDNCRQYYICENGVLVLGDCLKGNFFNSTAEVCQVDTDNVCPESCQPDCAEGEVVNDVNNCNQYHICQDGTWHSKTCPMGTYFDTSCRDCVIDSDNVCPQCETSENTTPSAPNDCNESDAAVKGDNCWSYYACISGTWQKESCAADYYFDDTIGICRKDDNSICPENQIVKTNVRKVRSIEQQDLEDSDNCTCPGNVTEGTMIAHPTDCDKYLICQNQNLVEGTCGQGNIFSSCNGVCMPDTDATCWICRNRPNGYQLPNAVDCTTYFTCSNGLAIPNSCSRDEWYNGNACVVDTTAQCINPCSCGTGNVANPICSKYYQCADGVAQVVDCPPGQGFNSSSGTCSATVECQATECATAESGSTFPVPDDNSKFYVCTNNGVQISSCPKNKVYVSSLGICLDQPSCNCDQSKCTNATLNTVYPPQNTDNTTFCLCQSDGAYLTPCLAGYIFDSEQEKCTFLTPCDPQVCINEPDYSPSVNYDDPNGFCLCRAGEPIPVPCPIGYTFNSNILKCMLVPQPDPRCCRNFCVNKRNDTTFPALNTDKGFCLCSDEVPIYHDCPINKIYDDSVGVCLEPNDCACNECDPYLCINAVENQVFPVEDSQSNFCYCKNLCPIYASCPNNTTLDPELLICMEPQMCNATMCSSHSQYQPFEAENGTAGFCYCVNNLPIYRLCPEGTEFNKDDEICLPPGDGCISSYCDSEKCSCLDDYESFPSSNEDDPTSFCFCKNGTAIYDNCPNRKVYNATEGVCMIPEAPCSVCQLGKCASLPENTVFSAENTTMGFCSCVEGVAVYDSCPEGNEFNTEYLICLSSVAAASIESTCDSTQCYNRAKLASFAAKHTTSGYCVCEADGTASYQSCSDDHQYDGNLNSCVVNACDPMQCRTRLQFEPFAAKNTSRGFCSCDMIPTYSHCAFGRIFDTSQGACVDELAVNAVACDPLECTNRVSNEPFASKETSEGFCSCDGKDGTVTFHKCSSGKIFDRTFAMCVDKYNIQKRSIEPEETFLCILNEKRSIPANCSQYEICLDGNWRKRTCTEERYYNPEQQRCLEPRDDMVCNSARVSGLPPCNMDSESEIMPYEKGKANCLQYFRCSAGKWRLRSCPKRQHYMPSLGTCLPIPEFVGDNFCEWINRTKSASQCQHLTVRPSPNDCSAFLMCSENNWWTHHCPLGMYFSRKLNYCVPNDSDQCQLVSNATATTACINGESRAIPSSCQNYELCVGGQWLRRTCNKLEQFEPLLGCVINDGSCQGNGVRRLCKAGEVRELPSINNNCTQFFYYCEADEWHLGNCLRGQSFVRELGKCQTLDKCRALLSGASTCLGQSDGHSVPHPNDCKRFYLCLHEQAALLQSCTAGSFFDAGLGYCRPNDGSCQLPHSICANTTEGLIPHVQNCYAYYNCSVSSHNDTLLYCPNGQYFDTSMRQCRLDQGQCSSTAMQPMSFSEVSRNLCQGLAHGTRIPHALHCNLYYVCVRSLAILVQCADKQYFSAVLGECVMEVASDTDFRPQCERGQLPEGEMNSATFSCSSLQDGSYVPDNRDCTKYYICARSLALTQRCADGTYFDAEQLLCLQDDGVCPYVRKINVNQTLANLNDTNMPPNPMMCEGKHGYIMADPANCNNFYICVSNKLRGERCYSGYFFNATLNQCEYMELPTADDKEMQLKTKGKTTGLVEHDSFETQPQLTEKCTDEPTDFTNLCEVIGVGASIAEPGDCRRYISCDESEPTSQRCRNGESYDSLLGICRQNDGTCLMENGERVGVCNKKHGQLAHDSDNCRRYFVCVHGQKIEAECEPGHYFNKATNTCQQDVLQQCVNENINSKPDELT
ncbi:hypothetical protein KR222_002346, partial [Zaprionus bogoriensis]